MNPSLLRPLSRRPKDPHFANVSLLLHMDGEDGPASFIDASPAQVPIFVSGDTQVDTAIKRFGHGSALFDGSGDKLDAAGSYSFAGDYTIEFWFYVSADNVFWSLVAFDGDAPKMHLHTYTDGNLYLNDAQSGMISGGPYLASTWHHVAIVRDAGTTKLFLDGAELGNTTDSIGQGSGTLSVGYVAGGHYLAGHIDELRVTDGVARYSDPFTPPAKPFPNR